MINPPSVFRFEKEAQMPEACVTLLVDQSGSMDLRRRQMAAMAIELAIHTLEICKIRCEVLGFTTRYTADNPVLRSWLQRGKPSIRVDLTLYSILFIKHLSSHGDAPSIN
ncbi:hypothetical protein HSBAA_63460 [Vreelandella sulfidaeris]|uniref:Cobalamin biosynthesis protein CobT VWA domain-containing protein n=1 Tax=Vreelandella sulfidaeris TaxID=115553 RepID=A0A455UFR0_9GAMM|nr:hypothetical protein HSBAA_63460 [Halomonas sulfidaeris]